MSHIHSTTSEVHLAAEALVNFLMSEGGKTDKSNGEVAVLLGINRSHLFDRARRHLRDCPALGGYTVGYRAQNQPLVLLDPVGLSTAILEALQGRRSHPLLLALRELKKAAETRKAVAVHFLDAASREAASIGNVPLSEALGYASRDVSLYGEVQPATTALLVSLGATTP